MRRPWILILAGATSNLVQGNDIGLDASGTISMPNGIDGVGISDSSGNTIGGAIPGAGNVISGNGNIGILIAVQTGNATGNLVQGNIIGTDPSGKLRLGNTTTGIFILNSPGNTIGGVAPDAVNVISSNRSAGIDIEGSTAVGNVVQGNLIGTDLTGSGQNNVGNQFNGVLIQDAPSTQVFGNTIAGNGDDGLIIVGAAATGSVVQGNLIGLDKDGVTPDANTGRGVVIQASGTLLGGVLPGQRNIISGNAGAGVLIGALDGNGNPLRDRPRA